MQGRGSTWAQLVRLSSCSPATLVDTRSTAVTASRVSQPINPTLHQQIILPPSLPILAPPTTRHSSRRSPPLPLLPSSRLGTTSALHGQLQAGATRTRSQQTTSAFVTKLAANEVSWIPQLLLGHLVTPLPLQLQRLPTTEVERLHKLTSSTTRRPTRRSPSFDTSTSPSRSSITKDHPSLRLPPLRRPPPGS